MSETTVIPKLENETAEFQKWRIKFDRRLTYDRNTWAKSANVQSKVLERLDKEMIKTCETLDQHTRQLEKLDSIDKKLDELLKSK